MSKVTPRGAVIRGHIFATVPVFAIILAFTLAGISLGGRIGLLWTVIGLGIGTVVGASVAWLWWSFAIPRWRDWVEDQGLSPADVQDLAARTRLLWPEGSVYERTEFRRRDGRRGW